MDPRGLAAGRPVNREPFPAGGRRHPYRQREGGGQTLHGLHRQCHRRAGRSLHLQPDWRRLGIGLAQRGAGSQQLPRRYLTGEGHLQRDRGQHRLLQNQGTAGNIQLELQSEDGTTLNNGSSQSVQVDEASQSARFPLQVRALSVNGGATQGTIQAVINVTYTYA